MIEIISKENILKSAIPIKLGVKYKLHRNKDEVTNNSVEILNKEKESDENIQIKTYSEDQTLDEGYARNIFKDILEKAVLQKASDIHIEPFEKMIIIRFRIDGELKKIKEFPINIYPYLSSIIKLEMSMDITEKRIPQDGRVDVVLNNNEIDIRASSMPTVYGEKIVLRILNRNSFLKKKEELGFSTDAVEKINNMMNKNIGIVLITGATGSGKTTTVYSLLNELRYKNKNIMTIEEPVEYKMEGINQTPVSRKNGISFESGLRSILRQDPDIIMLGEIRDLETAKMAIRAASTGHLVISTLHTNDAISSISRLIDMQIPPYLISESLIGVISQRLVKKVCSKCSEEIVKDNGIISKVAVGCENCNDGYIGRTAIYEILEIDDSIRESIKQMNGYKEIKRLAQTNNMITFEESAKRLIKDKITTIEECSIAENLILVGD
ncbi:GspE/PulE family protein [Romboutsia lituseburensis]|uniref:GspE/PulE family protein n=1 Tax=Romboutsia lituseburensis TaxID=1537 RepID=UPI00215A9C77|nr:GspE/PulE family protein [Romboutsia lituseburensis]MCR8746139.1 GspE/PulE family protein [Romboutsia lituseburensis]